MAQVPPYPGEGAEPEARVGRREGAGWHFSPPGCAWPGDAQLIVPWIRPGPQDILEQLPEPVSAGVVGKDIGTLGTCHQWDTWFYFIFSLRKITYKRC